MRRAALVAGGAAVAVLAASSPAWAWWTDNETVATPATTLTVARVPTTTCTASGTTATISWPVQTTPVTMTYSVKMRESGAAIAVTTSGGTASVQVSTGLLQSLGGTGNIDITTVLPGTTWTSAVRTRQVNIGLLGTSIACGAEV